MIWYEIKELSQLQDFNLTEKSAKFKTKKLNIQSGKFLFIHEFESSFYSILENVLFSVHDLENSNFTIEAKEFIFPYLKFKWAYGPILDCEIETMETIRNKMEDFALNRKNINIIEDVMSAIDSCDNWNNNEIFVYLKLVCFYFLNNTNKFYEIYNLYHSNSHFFKFKDKVSLLHKIFNKRVNGNSTDTKIIFSDSRIGTFLYMPKELKAISSLEEYLGSKSSSKHLILVGHGSKSKPTINIKDKKNDSFLTSYDLYTLYNKLYNKNKLFSIVACFSEDFNPNNIPNGSNIILFEGNILASAIAFSSLHLHNEFNRKLSNLEIYESTREVLFVFTLNFNQLRLL